MIRTLRIRLDYSSAWLALPEEFFPLFEIKNVVLCPREFPFNAVE